MMELAYKKVKTAIINMIHMLRSIQEKNHNGGRKVKDVTINLQIQETQQNHTEINHRLIAENQEPKT